MKIKCKIYLYTVIDIYQTILQTHWFKILEGKVHNKINM